MQRYFLTQDYFKEDHIQADPIMHKHILKVMRNHNGDQVIVIDEHQHTFLCTITDIDQGLLEINRELEEHNELDISITLIYGMPKGDKFEFVLQKATELGVTHIVPFLSQRSLIKMDQKRFNKKKQRYQRILQEASEQAHRQIIPTIHEPIKLKDIENYLSNTNIVAYEESKEDKHELVKQIHDINKSITIIIGPEGGFDKEEINYMESIGITKVGLGKRILRSETAPLYLLSVIAYEREFYHVS